MKLTRAHIRKMIRESLTALVEQSGGGQASLPQFWIKKLGDAMDLMGGSGLADMVEIGDHGVDNHRLAQDVGGMIYSAASVGCLKRILEMPTKDAAHTLGTVIGGIGDLRMQVLDIMGVGMDQADPYDLDLPQKLERAVQLVVTELASRIDAGACDDSTSYPDEEPETLPPWDYPGSDDMGSTPPHYPGPSGGPLPVHESIRRRRSQSSVIEIPYHADMRRARVVLNQYGIPHVAGVGIIEVNSLDESDAREALYSARIRHRR